MLKTIFYLILFSYSINGLLESSDFKLYDSGDKKPKKNYSFDEDIELFQLFMTEYSMLEGWTAEKMTENLFDINARKKAIESFKAKDIDESIVQDFKARFQNNYYYNYDHESTKSVDFKVFTEDYDENEYKLRKQFAIHMAKKVGDYHFNRFLKYHPRIKKVVKTVENIDVSVDIIKPNDVNGVPEGKPTKLKAKLNPFKTEFKLEVDSPIAENSFLYKINSGDLAFLIKKKASYFNMNFKYDIVNMRFNNDIKGLGTFSGSLDRKFFKDLTAKLEVKGEKGYGNPTVTKLTLSLPLHVLF